MTDNEVPIERFYDAVDAARLDVARRQDALPVEMNVPTKISDEDILAMDPGLGIAEVRAFLAAENGERYKVNRIGEHLEIAAFLDT